MTLYVCNIEKLEMESGNETRHLYSQGQSKNAVITFYVKSHP